MVVLKRVEGAIGWHDDDKDDEESTDDNDGNGEGDAYDG